MGKLHVEAEQVAAAPAGTVWALVSDATKYPGWGPWTDAGYRSPGADSPRGPGAVYWLRSARSYGPVRVVMVEQVLEADEGRQLAYTVLGGLPVRNYRGEITLTPVPGGTRIHWAGSWDQTLRGQMVYRPLRALYPQIVASLAAAAERRSGQAAGTEPAS